MKPSEWPDNIGLPTLITVNSIILMILGGADYLVGPDTATSVFYVTSLALIAWYGPRTLVITNVFLASFVWFLADYMALPKEAIGFNLFWNATVRLLSFAIITGLIYQFRLKHLQECEVSRQDGLTRALNFRACHERLTQELYRAQREQKTFSFAFIDLDNFKLVNDHWGHQEGDRLLQCVSSYIRSHIRQTDFLARLGGDEFGLFLDNTDKAKALKVLTQMKHELIRMMDLSQWPVTFSIGVVTFSDLIDVNPEQILALADAQMYKVKKSGKDGIKHITWPDTEQLLSPPCEVTQNRPMPIP